MVCIFIKIQYIRIDGKAWIPDIHVSNITTKIQLSVS